MQRCEVPQHDCAPKCHFSSDPGHPGLRHVAPPRHARRGGDTILARFRRFQHSSDDLRYGINLYQRTTRAPIVATHVAATVHDRRGAWEAGGRATARAQCGETERAGERCR
eukprot:5508799-Prymnesium_polylepis.1